MKPGKRQSAPDSWIDATCFSQLSYGQSVSAFQMEHGGHLENSSDGCVSECLSGRIVAKQGQIRTSVKKILPAAPESICPSVVVPAAGAASDNARAGRRRSHSSGD